jgi:hypothetical protein
MAISDRSNIMKAFLITVMVIATAAYLVACHTPWQASVDVGYPGLTVGVDLGISTNCPATVTNR